MRDDWTFGDVLAAVAILFIGFVIIVSVLWGADALTHVYDVWAQGKVGESEVARAEFNRQIRTLEAKATQESAKHLAEAEIIRAEGVAKANLIIGDSLQGNEAYLRYLWIDGLQHTRGQVIYVPTEANLPVLEATRGVR